MASARPSPVILVAPGGQFPGLSIHQAGSRTSLFPRVVVLDQTGDGLVRELQRSRRRQAVWEQHGHTHTLTLTYTTCLLPDAQPAAGSGFTICWMRWKLFPWKLKACSNRTLSSTVHSSGNGVKFGRSARDFSMLCLCQKSMPSACMRTHTRTHTGLLSEMCFRLKKRVKGH